MEIKGKRVMTDPGSYTISEQELERNIDLVVITHEHADHLHVESLKNILVNNPNAIVVTNTGVGKLLDEAGIAYEKLEDGNSGEFATIALEAYGDKHAEIYEDFGMVQNTGYLFDNKLFYPGDAFVNPNKNIDILPIQNNDWYISENTDISKKPIILSVSRLEKEKDIETLIRSFHIISKKYTEYKLVIVGDGSQRIKLENLVSVLSLRDRVV
jgi:glycosyltransferase involved in cell wall biosynthesis